MISASEAKELFRLPSYSEAEIEGQIKEAARDRDYTCFTTNRMTPELLEALKAAGYRVVIDNGMGDVIVHWN